MGKYILIDLEDTVTIHKDKEREKNIILEWLKYNKVLNPEIIYNNPDYKNRNDRIKLLNIDLEIYKKWYKNFKIVEFSVYYKNFFNKEIIINKDTIHFLKNCKIPLILVSNSSPLWIRYILKKYSLENCFKYIFYRTYDFDDIKKPDKKVLDIIENEIGDKIEKSSLIIGDSMSDFLFAKNCGLNFISVYKKFDGIKFFYSFADLENYILGIR